MDSSTEREDLEALIGSAGWARLSEAARQEFAGKLERGIEAALGETDDAVGLDKLRQIRAAKQAAEFMLGWPRERLSQLSRAAEAKVESGSRRGRL